MWFQSPGRTLTGTVVGTDVVCTLVLTLGGIEIDFKGPKGWWQRGTEDHSLGSTQEQYLRPSPHHIDLGPSSVGKLGENVTWGESQWETLARRTAEKK